MWTIIYANTVVSDDIPRLDKAVKQRLKTAIETKLTTDPLHFGKPLRYSLSHLRSLRVGDYRILYALDYAAAVVKIVSIGHRRDVYEG
jgi:mRNA interferase RelE/StbE